MKTPHKHVVEMCAFARGYEIEVYDSNRNEWATESYPFWHEDYKFRVKPEPKPNIVHERFVLLMEHLLLGITRHDKKDNVRFEFDGETNKLVKVEMI